MAQMLIDQTVEDVYNLAVGKPAMVRSGDVLKNAVDAMIANPVSQKVYVVDGTGKLLGMVTMQSLLEQVGNRIGARKRGAAGFLHFMGDILHENIEHFMVKPHKIKKNTTLVEAMKAIVDLKVNNLPIVDADGILIGELNGLEILTAARKLFKDRQTLDAEKEAMD